MRERDPNAVMIATTRFALPTCLHVPIAAKDIPAIERYIGSVRPVFPMHRKALMVEVDDPADMDDTLIVWDMPGCEVLHRKLQVWVHIDYTAYRKAYRRVHPGEDISGRVVDHIKNRRMAKIQGYSYVRVVPITRAANSSMGGLSEKWGVEFQSRPESIAWRQAHPTSIQYADVSDIAKMLCITIGNSLHVNHNDFQQRLRVERRK